MWLLVFKETGFDCWFCDWFVSGIFSSRFFIDSSLLMLILCCSFLFNNSFSFSSFSSLAFLASLSFSACILLFKISKAWFLRSSIYLSSSACNCFNSLILSLSIFSSCFLLHSKIILASYSNSSSCFCFCAKICSILLRSSIYLDITLTGSSLHDSYLNYSVGSRGCTLNSGISTSL